MNSGLILLIVAILCFLGVAIFAADMHGVEEVHRVLAAGLAAFAASRIGFPER